MSIAIGITAAALGMLIGRAWGARDRVKMQERLSEFAGLTITRGKDGHIIITQSWETTP